MCCPAPGRRWWIFCTIPLAVTLLIGGRLTDRLGYRAMLIVGESVFLAGSIGCYLAPSWSVLLAARGLQGLGAAAMLPASLAALTSLWAEGAARAKALGVWSSVSASATALGPVIGGLLIAWTNWRGVFAINIPLCAAALVGVFALDRAPTATDNGRRAPRSRSLAGASVAAFLMTTVGNGVLIAVTIYLQYALGLSALSTGLLMLIATVPFVAFGPLTGHLMHGYGRRRVACAGFATGALFLLALTQAGPGLAIVWIGLGLLGIGIALGLMTPSIVGEGMAALPGAPGLAGGLNNTARQLGTSVGVAASGALVAHHSQIVHGVHLVGVAAAAVWLLGGLVVVMLFQRRMPGSTGAKANR